MHAAKSQKYISHGYSHPQTQQTNYVVPLNQLVNDQLSPLLCHNVTCPPPPTKPRTNFVRFWIIQTIKNSLITNLSLQGLMMTPQHVSQMYYWWLIGMCVDLCQWNLGLFLVAFVLSMWNYVKTYQGKNRSAELCSCNTYQISASQKQFHGVVCALMSEC